MISDWYDWKLLKESASRQAGLNADKAGMDAAAAYDAQMAGRNPGVNPVYSTPYGNRHHNEPAPNYGSHVFDPNTPTAPVNQPTSAPNPIMNASTGIHDIINAQPAIHQAIIDVTNGNASDESYKLVKLLGFMINKLELTPERISQITQLTQGGG